MIRHLLLDADGVVQDLPGRNVAGARTTGLAAEQWHLDNGLPRLHELLAAHGLD